VLAAVQTSEVGDGEMAESVAELERLAHTLGLTVVDTITQSRPASIPAPTWAAARWPS
jgi:50S ribosomal subunit-associated GTPase HflX